jgi:hypothetical protein
VVVDRQGEDLVLEGKPGAAPEPEKVVAETA